MTARKKPGRFLFCVFGARIARAKYLALLVRPPWPTATRYFQVHVGYGHFNVWPGVGRLEALGNVNNPTSRIRGRVESYHLGGKVGLFSLYGGSRSVSER